MISTFKQHKITNQAAIVTRRCVVCIREQGERQGRLSGYRKANAPLTGWMNLVWGL